MHAAAHPLTGTDWFNRQRSRIDRRLDELVPTFTAATPPALTAAIRHPLTGGGKRLRPLLMLASYAYCSQSPEIPDEVVSVACVLELMHAASLIYDDLPCMDDATDRRGAAPVHVAHGESTALLAAISLMNAGYQIIGGIVSLPPATSLALVELLARTVGAEGLAAGQYHDLYPASDSRADLTRVRQLKTGILFQAAALAGAICAEVTADRRLAVSTYADRLGTAFQILDDLDDHDAPESAAEMERSIRNMLREADAALNSAERTAPLNAFIGLVFGHYAHEPA